MTLKRCLATAALSLLLTAVFGGTVWSAKVELNYALWASNPNDIQAVQARLDRFEQLHPNVHVNLLVTSGMGNHIQKMFTLVAAGQAPDVFMASRDFFYQEYHNHMFMPLDPYIKTDRELDWDDVIDHEQVTVDGHVIGLPEHGGGQQLAFNADLFNEAGLPLPTQLYDNGGWTTEAYGDALRKLTKDTNGDGLTDIFGSDAWTSTKPLFSALRFFGVRGFSADGTHALFTDATQMEALNWINDLDRTYGAVGGNFAGGTQALHTECPRCVFRDWIGHVFNFKWNIVPYPMHDPKLGYQNIGGHNFLAVYPKTQQPQLAYELASFLISKEVQQQALDSGAIFTPIRKSTTLAAQSRLPALRLDVFMKAASVYVVPMPTNVPDFNGNAQTLQSYMKQAADGQISVKEAAAQAASVVDAHIQELLNGAAD